MLSIIISWANTFWHCDRALPRFPPVWLGWSLTWDVVAISSCNLWLWFYPAREPRSIGLVRSFDSKFTLILKSESFGWQGQGKHCGLLAVGLSVGRLTAKSHSNTVQLSRLRAPLLQCRKFTSGSNLFSKSGSLMLPEVATCCHMLPKHVDSIHNLHFIPTSWAKGPEFDFMAGWCFSLAANRRGKGYTCSPCPNEPRTSQRELNQAASFLATICKHRILKVSHWIFKLLLQEGEALKSSNFEAIKHFTSVSMCKQILYYIELIYSYHIKKW